MDTNRTWGVLCAVMGFIIIVLNALEYLVGLSIPPVSLGIGLVLVAMGMYIANRKG